MPIDLPAILGKHLQLAWREERRSAFALSFLLPWLDRRRTQTSLLEQRSRAFPVLAFQGAALEVRLHRQQHGVLEAHSSTGSAWAAPFVAFGQGVAHVGQAVADELALPRLLVGIDRLLAHVGASMARFARPQPQHFDPTRATASDLFGILAMGYRGMASSTGQLRVLIRDAGKAMGMIPTAPTGDAPPPEAMPLSRRMDDWSRYLVAGLVLLPTIPGHLGVLAKAVALRLRITLLEQFESIQTQLFSQRTRVYEFFFTTLPRRLRDVPAVAAIIGSLLQNNIHYFSLVASLVFDEFTRTITRFLDDVGNLVRYYIGLVNRVVAAVDAVLDVDLIQMLRVVPGLGMIIDHMGLEFTIRDLFVAGGTALNWTMHASLLAALATAEAALRAGGWLVPRARAVSEALLRKLTLLREVVNALFSNTEPYQGSSGAPRLPRMPNAHALALGRRRHAELERQFTGWGRRIADDTRALLDPVATRLDDLGIQATQAAARFALTGPVEHMAEFGRDAAELSDRLFEDQVAPAKPLRGIAATVEDWLTNGGFHVVGAAIPLYVAQMRRYWETQEAAGEGPYIEIRPTSPHILARRARLGRVHMRSMTLRIGNLRLDDALAEHTARRFRNAVQEAYAEGQRSLWAIAQGAS